MLPLNQLEALSEAHAEIIKRKDELAKMEDHVKNLIEHEEWIKNEIARMENRIMAAVESGKKNIGSVYIYRPGNKNLDFWEMARQVIKEFSDQGFSIRLVTVHYDEIVGYTARIIGNDELKDPSFKIRQPNRITLAIYWEFLKPNENYNAPNFEDRLSTLRRKASALKELNEQADKIIAE